MERRGVKMFEQLLDLSDKVAVVTGAGSGIGLSLSRLLVRAGVRVAIVDRDRAAGQKAAEGLRGNTESAKAFYADISKENEVEQMVAAVEKEIGPVDILVNNAGINIRKKAMEFDLSEWEQILKINLTGTFITSRAVARGMIARRSGRIVSISSIASAIGLVDRAPYCASKAGVSQLTKVLAIEWAPYGITVNAIGPGYMNTPLIANLMEQPDFKAQVRSQVPLGRVGETEDLHGIILVLCSRAGAYITGQTIYIDGGWSIW
jgi:NAD(P)-dependent dehydrogenase (short-subunit alcohol dehydrogenase family)